MAFLYFGNERAGVPVEDCYFRIRIQSNPFERCEDQRRRRMMDAQASKPQSDIGKHARRMNR